MERRCAASMPVAMSAIIHWMAWKELMERPNCLRCLAYRTASSRHALEMPMAWDAMPMRPLSRALMATLNPSPGLPMRFSFATRQSSKMSSTVLEARSPILSSRDPTENPGVPRSMIKAERPLLPFSGPVRAMRLITSAYAPWVMNTLVPLIR